ncbi:hypothetical protein NIES4071_35080 [Calothrix sp. NIES-4071]|nr:hypothetical protein NIES4071_35080 [Calothrix sp. NIES-4071]BAZ57827.1 hypothetical protein NIES4105_35010 [Calothrix sp. NIES-4105]
MSNDIEFNRFSYVVGADQTIQNQLINWVAKSLQYINEFFDGDRSRIAGTKFGDCVSKTEYLADIVTYLDNSSSFRGVRDTSGRLQAATIISREYGIIYPYTEPRQYLSLDPFTSAPWNCLEGRTFVETVKGAGTWLMSEIIEEVIDTEIEGLIKLLAIDRARDFYLNIGFQENPDYEREMILTREASQSFIIKYRQKKEAAQ